MIDVLLIYKMIPENTKIYKLKLDSVEWERIRKLHGTFGQLSENSVELEDEHTWLHEFLMSKEPLIQFEKPGDIIHFTGRVVLTGFML